MSSIHTLTRIALLPLSLLAAMNVQAQAAKNCIELKNDAQLEQQVTDAQGNKTTKLVAPGKVLPGNEVIYTITASNVCDKAATNVVINNAVPEHMTYVMNSAMGVGTDMVFSLDGTSFAKLEALTVKNADGSTRAARAEDIKAIRWTYSTAINPGQSGFVRFRATVK
jgi:uncharacterized repeat protein (TIGR01451 family)